MGNTNSETQPIENNKHDYYYLPQYLTFWGLVISYTIFGLCILFKGFIPLWILLFAACLLTSIAVVGTLFYSFPLLEKDVPIPIPNINKTRSKVIAEDALAHSGPLLIFLLMFAFLVPRVSKPIKTFHFKKNFRGSSCSPIESNYFILTCIPALILSILYNAFADPGTTYENRNVGIGTIFVLLLAVFVSSYPIYFNWSQIILQK
jgi:hypothetical protein